MCIPIKAAIKPTKTFAKILPRAISHSPCSIRRMLSNENVEKVVNAPSKPTIKNGRQTSGNKPFSTISTYNRPKKRDPMELATNIARGKRPLYIGANQCCSPKRLNAPIAPPQAIATNWPTIGLSPTLYMALL